LGPTATQTCRLGACSAIRSTFIDTSSFHHEISPDRRGAIDAERAHSRCGLVVSRLAWSSLQRVVGHEDDRKGDVNAVYASASSLRDQSKHPCATPPASRRRGCPVRACAIFVESISPRFGIIDATIRMKETTAMKLGVPPHSKDPLPEKIRPLDPFCRSATAMGKTRVGTSSDPYAWQSRDETDEWEKREQDPRRSKGDA